MRRKKNGGCRGLYTVSYKSPYFAASILCQSLQNFRSAHKQEAGGEDSSSERRLRQKTWWERFFLLLSAPYSGGPQPNLSGRLRTQRRSFLWRPIMSRTRTRTRTQQLAAAGLIAAIYATVTLLAPIPQYMGVQFRVAEALTVLPFLFAEAIPGLAVGCFLANLLGSPLMLDWVFGTLATLLAALWTRRMPNPYLAALPPVICNAVIVGAEIAWFCVQEGDAFLPAYAINAFTVGLGEAVACYVLGIPLLRLLPRIPSLRGWLTAREF